MGRKSKDKGRRGELAVARLLSAWWLSDPAFLEEKATELPLRRTPMSGGWSKAKGVGGDIVPIDERAEGFPFSVEVKNRESWSFDGMLKNEGWPVHVWWKQCTTDAKASDLIPLLLFTKNNHPWYVCIKYLDLRRIRTESFTVLVHRGRAYCTLDAFVEHVTPASSRGEN